jgi:hypothetical protein
MYPNEKMKTVCNVSVPTESVISTQRAPLAASLSGTPVKAQSRRPTMDTRHAAPTKIIPAIGSSLLLAFAEASDAQVIYESFIGEDCIDTEYATSLRRIEFCYWVNFFQVERF